MWKACVLVTIFYQQLSINANIYKLKAAAALFHLKQNPNASEFSTCISLLFDIQPQFTLSISASSYSAF